MAPPYLDSEGSESAQLLQKSYADAVVEEKPKEKPKENGKKHRKRGNSTVSAKSKPEMHTAAVLRIVVPDEKEGPEEDDGMRPELDRKESTHEYSATGLDDSPRTPPKKKQRKMFSQKGEYQEKARTNGIDNKAQADAAENENESSNKSSIKGSINGSSDSTNNKDNKEASNRIKFEEPKIPDTDKHITDDTTVVDKVTNGHRLTSVKPTLIHEKVPDTEHKKTPKKGDELASGRIAGQRWQSSGIRFAPLNVPLQRRLQTFVVLIHTLCVALSVSIFFFLCAIPLFWPLLIPYLIYCLTSKASTSGTLTHRLEFFRRSPVWSLYASYFPARLHRTQELPSTRKYIFGYHPHGIISFGAFGAFATEALGFEQLFPGIKNTLLTLDSNFRIPIYRDYALAMGLSSVSKESCENLLTRGGANNEGMGRGITIVIGGARESLDAHPYSMRLVLKRRKGFVKLAIRTGADLVPVLAFGENDLYDQFNSDSHPIIHKFQLLVKKFLGFTIPLFHARGVFNYDVGLMPYRRPLNVVVGKPIRVAMSSMPEQGEIDRVHEEYIVELERLWDAWKDEFAPNRKEEIKIVD